MNEVIIAVEKEDAGKRIDAFVATADLPCDEGLPELSRSFVQKMIEDGNITVCGQTVKNNYKVKDGDVISMVYTEPQDPEIVAEDIALDIVYEDDDIIVINKPRGMVVHPAPGNYSGTLVNALMFHCGELSDINGVKRPGIVHRIDKDTTGLLVVAKNNKAHHSLTEQLKTHTVARTYYAVVEGVIRENSGTIDAPCGRHPVDRKKMCVNTSNGKHAVTHFKVIERFEKCTYVECRLETGRTHQIRVHMSYIGHPVTGDPMYGIKNNRGMTGQALHAGRLELIHPSTGELVKFEALVPADFSELLNRLKEE